MCTKYGKIFSVGKYRRITSTFSLAMSSLPKRSSSAGVFPLALVPAKPSVTTVDPFDKKRRSGVQPKNAVLASGFKNRSLGKYGFPVKRSSGVGRPGGGGRRREGRGGERGEGKGNTAFSENGV